MVKVTQTAVIYSTLLALSATIKCLFLYARYSELNLFLRSYIP